nr:innexin shaking-B-like [Leptinotarsa decemlineata]
MGKPKPQRVIHKPHLHQNLRFRKFHKYHPESRSHRKATRRGNRDMDIHRNLLTGIHNLTQATNGLTIDSLVFRLHTNATVLLLVSFSIAVTTRQYVGHPIDCVHIRDIPEDVLNTYCWIHSTFTVKNGSYEKQTSEYSLIPNIQTTGEHPIKQIKYYQWVEMFLIIQLSPDDANMVDETSVE